MKNKYFILIIVFVILICLIISCKKTLVTETRNNDTVSKVSAEDIEMNKIISDARKTVDDFVKELTNPNTKAIDFTVKYPFATDPGSGADKEHIWLSDIVIKNNKYYGVVANEPFYIKNMKINDIVEFDINEISDWKYILDGYLVGGKSIIYFYDQMSDKEKKDFEEQAGFKIRK
jgi:uncharacterized protein YegJ (DUF2314 family)